MKFFADVQDLHSKIVILIDSYQKNIDILKTNLHSKIVILIDCERELQDGEYIEFTF